MVSDKDIFGRDGRVFAPAPPDAVEVWLRGGFKDRYEAAITEPVPDELIILATRLCH
jgi:hypothetical protein